MKEMKRILSLVLCLAMLVGMLPMFALKADAATGEFVDAAIFCSDVHDSTDSVSSVFAKIAESGITYSTANFCGDTFSDSSSDSADVTAIALGALEQETLVGNYTWGDHDSKSDITDQSCLIYSGNYYVYLLSMGDLSSNYAKADDVTAEIEEFTNAVAAMDKTKPLFIASHLPLHARRSDNIYAEQWTTAINAAAKQMDVVFFWGHNHTGEAEADTNAYYVAKGSTLNVETTKSSGASGAGTSSSSTGTNVTINFTYMNAGYIGSSAKRGGYATTVQIYSDALVFQDYTSSGAFTGDYSHNVEVKRAFASAEDTTDPTEESTEATEATKEVNYILYEGTTAYTVGDTLTFNVTVVYTDSSMETVTQDDCQLTMTCSAHAACADVATAMQTVACEQGDYHQVTVTYGGKSVTYDFTVGAAEELTGNAEGVVVSVSSGVVASVTAENSANTYVADVMAAKGLESYAAYDISPENALKAGNYATVKLPLPEGAAAVVVYYISDDGATVTDMNAKIVDGKAVFTTDHFSTYVVGTLADGTDLEGEDATVEDSSTTTYTTENVTVYKLVATPESGKTYLIVNSATGTGYGLDGDTTGYVTTAFTGGDGYYSSWDEASQTGTAFSAGSDVYLTTDDAYLWTAGSNSFTIGYSSSGYIGDITNTLDPDNSTTATWTLANNQLTVNLKSYEGIIGSDTYTDYYLTNSGSSWSMSTSGSNVYFYEPVTVKKVTETTTGTEGGTYTAVGTDVDNLEAQAGATVELTSELTFTSNSGTTSTPDGWTATYEVVTTKGTPSVITSITDGVATLSGTAGTAVVKVSYTNGTLTVWDEFTVTAYAPVLTGIEISNARTDYSLGETFDADVVVTAYYTVNGVAKTKVLTADEYTVDSTAVNTDEEGTYAVSVSYTLNGVTKTDSYEITVTEVPSNEITIGGGSTVVTYNYTATANTDGTGYILVSNGYALQNNNGTIGAVAVTVSDDGSTITVDSSVDVSTILWTIDSDGDVMNDNYYLLRSSGSGTKSMTISTTDSGDVYSNWTYSSNTLTTTGGSGGSTTFYAYASEGTFYTQSSSSQELKFYVPSESAGSTTYTMRAENMVKVVTDTNNTETIDYCLQGNGTDLTSLPSDGSYSFTVLSDGNSIISSIASDGTVTFTGTEGTAKVKVAYTWTAEDGNTYTVYKNITIEATGPYYDVQLHYASLTEVASDATFDSDATYYVFNSTTNVYEKVEITEFAADTTYYTTPVVQGDEINEVIALKGIEAGDRYPVWAVVKLYDGTSEEGTDLDDVDDDQLLWTVSNTNIATIDPATGVLTFTGEDYGTFTVTVYYLDEDDNIIDYDTIVISATDSLYVVPGDGTNDFPEYPNEGAVRFDKTATAVGNFSETGIALVELSMTGVPYTTGSEIDVVLMLDITGSMQDVTNSSYTSSDDEYYTRIYATVEAAKAFARAIVLNEDGSYNGNRIGIYSFNSGGTYTLHALSAITDIDALDDEIETFADDYKTGGTPYDEGLALVQSTLAAAKTDVTGNDRQQFAVFMSDGVPTDYEYITGTTHANYSSAANIAAMLDSSDDYATRKASGYYYEYYSTEMKADGVTVYTVGLGLNNTNSAWSGTATQCYNVASALLNDISGPANEASQPDQPGTSTKSKLGTYFFSVDDADAAAGMGTVFSNIAQKIVEAAKDVEVVDEIGNNYAVNFSLPNNVTSEETNGLSEFYIQVVEYQLDSNKERTGNPTVLENVTFTTDSDGNLSVKSHTIDGTSCGTSCTHVTIENNEVTAINGTYFTYTTEDAVDENGKAYVKEILTWEADKLTTTELALQYFVFLENSADKVATNDEIAAGTYYTNEEATLTYTNYLGNRVQREFPIPQMTWNGAQVHYVFYLVNEAGQPVNTAGRVIPFAEAIYVTDVHSYMVYWNDMEQSTGLEAKYLAEELVPEVYALYDDDASYNIHVYEDENAVNLNNHFVIGGDVTDDYNTVTNSWTNANTTYVFNTKHDATKYNTVGTYIASDGTTADVTTYLCKGDGTVTANIEEVSVADDTAFNAGTYYVLNDDGDYERPQSYSANATYYAITSASYVAAAGETQALASGMESTSGGTIVDGYVYYIDENNEVYTIVQKSNGTEVYTGFDFHNTTVAFAVVWKPELNPDTVVVDYGLDVVIDVTTNDSMAAGVVGVRTDAPSGVTQNSGSYAADKEQTVKVSLDGTVIGTASVESLTSVRFSLNKSNGMLFNAPVEFYYESDVNYYDSNNALVTTSMYSSVTVIPATTIYYEDEYVTLTTHTLQDDGSYTVSSGWDTNSASASATQKQDRPGASKISAVLDADNNYGYDAAYSSMSSYSMKNAACVTVYSGKYATATFTFYGTGFDVISLTDTTTGTIFVKVADENGATVKNVMVDTYYGYKYENDQWVTTESNDPNALYQVPVIKVEDLDYGKYTVTITASYVAAFDNVEDSTSYDFYLDAIRIYDPTGNQNDVANEAYVADGEAYPEYFEVRNEIIEAATFDSAASDTVNGIVFIDGIGNGPSIADYTSYGPNNEVYLAANQAIAFDLNATANNGAVAKVQLAVKTVGGTASVKVYSTDGTVALDADISTATDMYYDITALNGKTVVIMNDGTSGIVSITNVKVTYTAEQTTTDDSTEEAATPAMFMLSRSSVNAALATMSVEEDDTTDSTETTEPETTEPETTEPETTEPETTEPETTEPETTEPETTEPETTEPEVTEPEETEPSVEEQVQEIIEEVKDIIKKIFGWLFG